MAPRKQSAQVLREKVTALNIAFRGKDLTGDG